MITALLGKPGAGKSYEAVRLARDAVAAGRPLVTNLPLKDHEGSWWSLAAEGQVTRVPPFEGEGAARQYAFSRVSDWQAAEREPVMVNGVMTGPLVVVDECQWAFSSMMVKGADAIRELAAVEGFLATHRHHFMDVVLLAQNHTQLPLPVKHLIEEWRELVGLTADGLPGYSAKTFKSWTGYREPLDTKFRRYDKKIFELYDSHALGGGAGQQGTGMRTAFRRLSILRHWSVWTLPLGAIALVWAAWTAWGVIDRSLLGGVRDEVVDLGGVAEVESSVGAAERESESASAADGGDAPVEDDRPAWPTPWPPTPVFPRDWLAPGQYGEPGPEHFVPPAVVPVIGMVSGVVVWADGTTLDVGDLAERGVWLRSAAMCEVWMASADFRLPWRCARPGG